MPAVFKKFRAWQKDFLSRRPHRSFLLTRRRDYVRELKLPGYFSFTHTVNKTMWSYRKTFLLLAALYLVIYAVLVGLGSQETYSTLTGTLQEAAGSIGQGDISQIGQAGLIFLTIASVGISDTPTEAQQIYTVLIALLVWLTTVWLLRNKLAGHKVTLRDGLYNAGAPIVPMFLVSLALVIQLVPVLLAAVAYGAASASGLLNGGVEAMLFWIGASLLALLSLFWVTSTLFGLIIVTIPGMYPLKALRTAGDLVLGRRVRILLRWLWMILAIAFFWAVILIPLILLDLWLKSIWPALGGFPFIPIVIASLSTSSVIWGSGYVYLLYRKVVDEHSK